MQSSFAQMERRIATLRERLLASGKEADRVAAELLSQMLEGEPRLGEVAVALALGERTLQRRLRAAGFSFRSLATQVRRQLAELYLVESSLPVTEIAFRLGFSAPSAFHRAFKRWTGLTPLKYRQSRRTKARARAPRR